MIELELIRPELGIGRMIVPFLALIFVVLGMTSILWKNQWIIGIACVVTGAILLIIGIMLLSYFQETELAEWRELVEAQIERLPCEDLQEAHELYDAEFIKEKFLFECVDTRGDWWK